MIDTSFLKQLDRFNLIIKKKITSSYSGLRQSPSYGRGLIFKDHREYCPGDDIRAIDWNVFARTDNFFIKRFEEERNLTMHILLDVSASMNFGKDTKKFVYGSMIGLGFAYMALKNNERFVFSTFSDTLRPFKARKGAKQLVSIVDYLNKTRVTGSSNFKAAMEAYKKLLNSKSLIVIISDFLFDVDEVKASLLRFKKSEVIIVQVLDPEEKQLNYQGDLVLHDSESNDVLQTFLSRRVREKYKQRLTEHLDSIQELCTKINAKFITVTTDQPIFDAFYEALR